MQISRCFLHNPSNPSKNFFHNAVAKYKVLTEIPSKKYCIFLKIFLSHVTHAKPLLRFFFLPLENLMSRENRRKALSPWQPLNGQRMLRICGSRQNEVRKDPLILATVNLSALSGRSRELVLMFERRKVDTGSLQEVTYQIIWR